MNIERLKQIKEKLIELQGKCKDELVGFLNEYGRQASEDDAWKEGSFESSVLLEKHESKGYKVGAWVFEPLNEVSLPWYDITVNSLCRILGNVRDFKKEAESFAKNANNLNDKLILDEANEIISFAATLHNFYIELIDKYSSSIESKLRENPSIAKVMGERHGNGMFETGVAYDILHEVPLIKVWEKMGCGEKI